MFYKSLSLVLLVNVVYSKGMKMSQFNLTKKPLVYLLICLAGCILLNSCVTPRGVLQDRNFKKRETQYRIGDPGKNWRRLSLKDADLAWINELSRSTLLVNSQCKEAKDVPLTALTVQLLIGMTEQNIESQRVLPWSDREALETVVTAKIDGIFRKLSIFVLKKDGCVYDIIFAAPSHFFDKEVLAYQVIRDQFDVGSKK
jgi:hypothetical protein